MCVTLNRTMQCGVGILQEGIGRAERSVTCVCVLVSLLLTNKSPADVVASGDNDFLTPVVSGDGEMEEAVHRTLVLSGVCGES